jgi:acetoin utilization deacetylase AcuC-like enzyme
MSVGVVYDPIYLKHDTGEHPENSKRLVAITEHLQKTGLWDKLTHLVPRPATEAEIRLVHTEAHIREVREMAESGGDHLDSDTPVSRDSYQAAIYAAGGMITAVEAVMDGAVGSAFGLVRPPGHHATRKWSMGFCLFNNIAIAAACALEKYRLKRILILDWDVHHGNGTQDIFQAQPKVNYFSLHQSPLYPGSGDMSEVGVGNTINIPLPPGSGDAEYIRAVEEVIIPAARRFKPQLMLVSAGYDAHWADHLANMQLSISGYAELFRRVKGLADELCQGRLAVALEGGYNLNALAGGVAVTFEILLGCNRIEDDLGPAPHAVSPDISSLIARLKTSHRLS